MGRIKKRGIFLWKNNFANHRYRVKWGGCSILKATFSLLEQTFKNERYELHEEYYGDTNRADSMEKYIAPLFNCMLDKGMNVSYSIVNKKSSCFGDSGRVECIFTAACLKIVELS